MSSLPLAALALPGGFASDVRFGPAPSAPPEIEDPVATARAEGRAAGLAEARAEAAAQAMTETAARERVATSLARIEAEQEERMRERLAATVVALCEAAIAPLTLDREALVGRIEKASAMLVRADDDKVLHLHPADLDLIAGQLPPGLPVLADPSLEPGSLRFETGQGGVEDGPANWRRAIAEALQQC